MSAVRGVERDRSGWLFGLLHLLDLGRSEVPELEPFAGGVHERIAVPQRRRQRAVPQHVAAAESDKVLLLRREKLGAVHSQQLLAFRDRLPREIHEHFFDPALGTRVHVSDPGLVGGDARVCTDRLPGLRVLGGGVGDTDHLLLIGADMKGSGRWRGTGVLVHRLKIIAGFRIDARPVE